MVVAAYDWSGFYIGMNGGGAWSRKCWDIAPFTTVIIGGPAVTIPGGRLPHGERRHHRRPARLSLAGFFLGVRPRGPG